MDSECSPAGPELTSENQKFGEGGHELVVLYPASGLELVPQGSEGFVVQIQLCGTKNQVSPSGGGKASARTGGLGVTAVRSGLFQLLPRERGGSPAVVAFHILPPDHRHKVLQFEDLRQIQVSRFVCLNVLVTRNNPTEQILFR